MGHPDATKAVELATAATATTPTHAKPCRHCGRTPAKRPRGLCWTCFNDPDIRGRYAPTTPAGRYGTRQGDNRGSRPLGEPTAARPGTPEKLAVLIERAAAGQELWHPLDATQDATKDDATAPQRAPGSPGPPAPCRR